MEERKVSGQISCISRKRCLSPSFQDYSNDDENEEKKLRLEVEEKETYKHLQMVANIRSRKTKNAIFKSSPYSYRCALCNIYFEDPKKCWNHRGSQIHLEHFKRNPNSIQFELCFNWKIATTENVMTNKKVNEKIDKITSWTPLTGHQTKESATNEVNHSNSSKTTTAKTLITDTAEDNTGKESSIRHSNKPTKHGNQTPKPIVQYECKLCGYTAPRITVFNGHLRSTRHIALLKDGTNDFSEFIYISTSSWVPRKSRKGPVRYVKKANRKDLTHQMKDATLYCPSCDINFDRSEVNLNSVAHHFNSDSHKLSLVDGKEDCAIVKRLWTLIV